MATVTYIKETRQHPSAMVSVMRYCLQESKTVDQITGQRYVSGIGCDGLNSITEFLATKIHVGAFQSYNFSEVIQWQRKLYEELVRIGGSKWRL